MYPTNALEVLIYVARLSFFRRIPIPHYCILPKNISVSELLKRPIALRCVALLTVWVVRLIVLLVVTILINKADKFPYCGLRKSVSGHSKIQVLG